MRLHYPFVSAARFYVASMAPGRATPDRGCKTIRTRLASFLRPGKTFCHRQAKMLTAAQPCGFCSSTQPTRTKRNKTASVLSAGALGTSVDGAGRASSHRASCGERHRQQQHRLERSFGGRRRGALERKPRRQLHGATGCTIMQQSGYHRRSKLQQRGRCLGKGRFFLDNCLSKNIEYS